MKEVGSYEAKTHLPALLERVSKGERVTITKHGVAIALLVPAGVSKKGLPSEVISELRQFRQGRKLRPLSVRKMKEAGRR